MRGEFSGYQYFVILRNIFFTKVGNDYTPHGLEEPVSTGIRDRRQGKLNSKRGKLELSIMSIKICAQ